MTEEPSTIERDSVGSTGGTTTVRLVRSTDQLDVSIELVDAVVVDGTQVVASGPDPRVRFTFGSQHVAERTFARATPSIPTRRLGHIAAGPSVVVVAITGSIPFTIEGLLAAAEIAVDATTAIEVPTGLMLSPASPARLVATGGAPTTSTTAELWVARLEPIDANRLALTAVENRSPTDLVATRVPDAAARDSIVANSTTIAPLAARRMWLSSAGAWADVHGEWPTGLASYDHRAVTGRDVHVQVVNLGYLLPFGHRAAIAEVSHRDFLDDEGGRSTAVMRVERFLTIVEPVVAPRAFAPHDGRALPLRTLTATTSEVTPIRLRPVADALGELGGVSDIVARGSGDDIVIDYLATDRRGDPVSFALPATFIDDAVAHQTGADEIPARVGAIANGPGRRARRQADLQGQPVAYADPLGADRGTSKSTHRMLLRWDPPAGAAEADLLAARSPAVFASLEHADVVDDAVGSVTGTLGAPIGVTLHPRWLSFGNLADNFDLAFLALDVPAPSLIGAGSAAGGVAQLEVIAEVFNQSVGMGPDLESIASPWDPEEALGEASRVLGNIALSRLVAAVEGGLPGLDIPASTVSIEGDTITAAFTFCPTLHDLPAVGFRTVPGRTRCCFHLTTTASVSDTVEASFTTEMRVQDFLLEFPPAVATPLVTVDFASVVGTIGSDGSASIVPDVREWDFSGAISMLMALVDHLGLGNVDLEIRGDVIDMDTSITLPDISLGVAELKNFAIAIGMDLPLGEGTGQLSIGVGTKASPLDIDILMFGATFWLDIDLGFGGGTGAPTQTIAMGVSVYWELLDFDIVVVSIAFTLRLSADWTLTGDEVVFTGAVSLEGEIDVLGLVSVSASIVCSLTYDSAAETMVLKGTVNYCVDSFLGTLTSGTVPIGRTTIDLGDGQAAIASLAPPPRRAAAAAGAAAGAQRQGGSASFADRYSAAVWTDYCDAFA